MAATPMPTPRQSQTEFATYSGSTVAIRWPQVSPVPPAKRLAPTASTGSATRTASAKEKMGSDKDERDTTGRL
jgi:hypothetical protein